MSDGPDYDLDDLDPSLAQRLYDGNVGPTGRDDPGGFLHGTQDEVAQPAELRLVRQYDELSSVRYHGALHLDEQRFRVREGCFRDAFDSHECLVHIVVGKGVSAQVVQNELGARVDGPLRHDDRAPGMPHQVISDGEGVRHHRHVHRRKVLRHVEGGGAPVYHDGLTRLDEPAGMAGDAALFLLVDADTPRQGGLRLQRRSALLGDLHAAAHPAQPLFFFQLDEIAADGCLGSARGFNDVVNACKGMQVEQTEDGLFAFPFEHARPPHIRIIMHGNRQKAIGIDPS